MRPLCILVTSLLLGPLSAQQGAEQAFREATAAFEAGRFEAAADLFETAAHTDVDNPEVFLWLGRTRYELGQLDRALAAWRRTLELAPEEPLAQRMVAALTGRDLDADRRLQLVEELLADGLTDSARAECRRIRDSVVLDAAGRARLGVLTARVEIARGDGEAAMRELREAIAADAAQEDRPEVQLALGRAEVLLGGERRARGLLRLRRVAAEHADTPAGIRARLEVLRTDLKTRNDATARAALRAWIEAHGDDPGVLDARRALWDAHVRAAAEAGNDGEALDADSAAALALAAELWPAIDAAEKAAVAQRFLELFTRSDPDDPRAAITGLLTVRALGLAADTERTVVRALADLRTKHALARLEAALRAGAALDGAPTEALRAARASLIELRDLDRERGAVAERLALAGRLHELAASTSGSEDGGLHACDRWAVEIALEVARDTRTDAAAAGAAAAVTRVVDAAAARGLEGLRAAAVASEQLASALDPERIFAVWSDTLRRRLEVLDALARAELTETLAHGAGVAPTEATDIQRAMVAVAIQRARRDAAVTGDVIALLARHAALLATHDRADVGAGLLSSLAQGLPAAEAPPARTAAIGVLVDAELRDRARRAAGGLPVAARLGPTIQRALEGLYALEADVRPGDLPAVRALRARIVDHFRGLEQFAVAEQAIAVRGPAVVDSADAWGELRLAHLRKELAVRELDRTSAADGPPEITPAFRAALDAYREFLARRAASSDLANEAVTAVLDIAARFERARGHQSAIVVYQELADVLGALTAPAELRLARAAQAAFAAAAATDARAQQLLNGHSGADLDAEAEAAVQAALTAYAEFVTAYPDSPLLAHVLPRQLALGLAVARHGAWAAAERVFATLKERGVRQVDRVEFCRAMCVLGPAFGDHALAMLASTIEADLGRSGGAARAAGPATGGREAEEPAPDAASAEDSLTLGAFAVNVRGESLGADADRLLQTVRQLEQQRAQQIAALRGQVTFTATQAGQPTATDDGLTDAEIERIRRVFDAAYAALIALRREHSGSPYAEPARGTVLAMVDRWRSLSRWSEAADLANRFLTDEPTDRDRDTLRLGVARDLATFASRLPAERGPVHEVLRTISERFDRARAAFDVLLPENGGELERDAVRVARWERAATFLAQARTVAQLRPGLARGRFVLAARELAKVAAAHPDHPQASSVPNQLWSIGDELIALGFHDEAVAVRRELWVRHPTHPLADRAALSIAQLYRGPLGQPLRAAELLQELNFARGGADASLQEAILAVGLELHAARRWVEALHVLETFVDSFPQHPRAGEALTQIGQVHQQNGAYADAIAAYRRVIAEYPSGDHVGAARWAIAECWIHRSDWRRAMDAYLAFRKAFPKDARAAETDRRIDVLKSLLRYQQVVDETGQRKAFDAQYQIAVIVRAELSLPRKAIQEFEKVPGRWPESHLADDALFEVGETYLGLGATSEARDALMRLAQRYPQSPLADDALYLVGKSYEDEADRLGSVTRADSARLAQELAQRLAYGRAQDNVRRFRDEAEKRIADLKKEGKLAQAEDAEATLLATTGAFRTQNAQVTAQWASNEAEVLTAAQLADREDRIRAALRRAVASYEEAAQVAGGDKAGEALLRMARIHDERLEDPEAAMATWLEIVRQFSGTAVAEDASWKIAQFHDRHDEHGAAIEAYQAFLRNYRRSPNAGGAQAAIAENYELLGEWVHAMDAYTNYINNFPDGPLVERAREQIAWIKTYRL